MGTVIRELQYALRRLGATPGFTVAATLTLALAIGATASVFGVVDGVLLKAFPVRDPERVLTIWESNPDEHLPVFQTAPANYLDWRSQNTVFAAVAAAQAAQFTVAHKEEPERLWGLVVSPSYFSVLGVTPTLGRALAEDPSGPPEIVISSDYWQRRFGGAGSALGQSITLDDRAYTVVGVMPPGLSGPFRGQSAQPQLWTRLSFTGADEVERGSHTLYVYGRLKTGVTRDGAVRDMNLIAQRLAEAYPLTNKGWSVVAIPFPDQLLGPVRPALLILLCAAACVLLIGTANLANLFLVRCLAREREMALRTALGATHGRLVRELLAEASMLGLGAGVLGLGLAVVGVRVLRGLAPSTLPRVSQIGFDGRVIAFGAFTTIVTVLIFGILPAWQITRGNLATFLKEGGRGTASPTHGRLQNGLVVLQVAVALVLLTGAGLLVESFEHFERMDPGFKPDGVLTAELDLSKGRYPTSERQAAFMSSVVERLAALPGVTAVSASDAIPAGSAQLLGLSIVGDPAQDPSHMPIARVADVTPNYFHTMGIMVLRGRGLLPTDDSRSVKVAVLDELTVRRYFAGRDPLGLRLTFFGPDTVEIVGVVAAAKQRGLAAEEVPGIYRPFAQFPGDFAYVEVRTPGNPGGATAAVRQAIADVDRGVPVSDVKTMAARLTDSVGTTRFSTFLASLFAGVALLLGMVGIYGVLAFVVSQRQREIGIRLALGASRSRVVGDVLQRAVMLAGTGIVLGSGAAWVLTHAMVKIFGGATAYDPGVTVQGWLLVPTFIGSAAAFAVVAVVAACVPAFRTTRINPVVALKSG